MRLGKNLKVWLIAMGVVVFTAGSVQAGGVIEEWVARYNGPGNGGDGANAIAVDGSGNIYVTGVSYNGYPYYDGDYATIKYDSTGNELWVRRYNGLTIGVDSATAIAVDGSGNVYVTGESGFYYSSTYYDYATIKYDSAGNEIWVRRYNGPGNYDDMAFAIAVDGSGNIYVTGQSDGGSSTDGDYATIKYDPNGVERWVRRYNGPGNGGEQAYAIAVDNSGNIYVTGRSYGGSSTDDDYATIKYDTNGNELWVRRYNGPGNSWDSAYDIAVDGSGNVNVTGHSWSGTSDDYATIKYNSAGNELWVRRYNGPANDYDSANAIAVDGSGNIYVTGASGCYFNDETGTWDYDYATIKYDTNGGEQWVRRYNGPANGEDEATAIAVDGSCNIYVTGLSYYGSGTHYDYATIKYDPNGNELWIRRYNGPGGANAIAVDNYGNIYVTGTSDYDYATIKYSQHPVILTMQTEPVDVNTVTPPVGDHEYAQGIKANISAERFVDCPDVYVFDHWEGDVNDPNSANTTVLMDNDKTVTAVFIEGRQCGDECHPYPIGDLDKDCVVTFGDFALFASHWLDCTKPECD